MQHTNKMDDEGVRVLALLELYRLQSLRRLLFVVLLMQFALLWVALMLVFRGHELGQSMMQSSTNSTTENRGRNGFEFHPDEAHRGYERRQFVAGEGGYSRGRMAGQIPRL